jgi:hypothetical protein
MQSTFYFEKNCNIISLWTTPAPAQVVWVSLTKRNPSCCAIRGVHTHDTIKQNSGLLRPEADGLPRAGDAPHLQHGPPRGGQAGELVLQRGDLRRDEVANKLDVIQRPVAVRVKLLHDAAELRGVAAHKLKPLRKQTLKPVHHFI